MFMFRIMAYSSAGSTARTPQNHFETPRRKIISASNAAKSFLSLYRFIPAFANTHKTPQNHFSRIKLKNA